MDTEKSLVIFIVVVLALVSALFCGMTIGMSSERHKWKMTCVERGLGHYVVKNNQVVFEWIDNAEK